VGISRTGPEDFPLPLEQVAFANQVMTLAEVARYLKLAEKTVLRMVHKGEIPCAKVASQWRFLRPMIDDWLVAKMQVIPKNDLARLIENGSDTVPLSRLIREELIVLDVRPGGKQEVLGQLVQPLVENNLVDEKERFLEKLMDRERMVSTAVGRGVAVPHLRNPREDPGGGPVLVVGICRAGTGFGSPDGEKTHLFFLICTDSEVVHLRVLARFNSIVRKGDTVSRLIRSNTRAEVMQTLLQMEQEGGKR